MRTTDSNYRLDQAGEHFTRSGILLWRDSFYPKEAKWAHGHGRLSRANTHIMCSSNSYGYGDNGESLSLHYVEKMLKNERGDTKVALSFRWPNLASVVLVVSVKSGPISVKSVVRRKKGKCRSHAPTEKMSYRWFRAYPITRNTL